MFLSWSFEEKVNFWTCVFFCWRNKKILFPLKKYSYFITIFLQKMCGFHLKNRYVSWWINKSVEIRQWCFGAKTIILLWKENVLFPFEKITVYHKSLRNLWRSEQKMFLSWWFEGKALVLTGQEDLLLLFEVNNFLSQIVYDIVQWLVIILSEKSDVFFENSSSFWHSDLPMFRDDIWCESEKFNVILVWLMRMQYHILNTGHASRYKK